MTDTYTLDELISRLEEIKELKDGYINFPKAFYSLALEIRELKCKAVLHNGSSKIYCGTLPDDPPSIRMTNDIDDT